MEDRSVTIAYLPDGTPIRGLFDDVDGSRVLVDAEVAGWSITAAGDSLALTHYQADLHLDLSLPALAVLRAFLLSDVPDRLLLSAQVWVSAGGSSA